MPYHRTPSCARTPSFFYIISELHKSLLAACHEGIIMYREVHLLLLIELALPELILIDVSDVGRAHLFEQLGANLLDQSIVG